MLTSTHALPPSTFLRLTLWIDRQRRTQTSQSLVSLTAPGVRTCTHTLTLHTVPPPTVSVTSSELVYHGTNHTLSCTASYDMSVVDTPVSLVFTWTGPGGPLFNNAITMISSGSSESTLHLSPVDRPSVSSGDYTCTVTAQSGNALVQSGSGSDSVRLTVFGECVGGCHVWTNCVFLQLPLLRWW